MFDRIPSEFVIPDNIYIEDENLDEVWEYCPCGGNYYVSNKGRVWSGSSQKFLKPKKADREGHLGVCLCIGGNRVYKYIHRLVAEAFIPNETNLPIVRHLDDDKDFNWENNLAWGTQKDNARDCIKNGNAYTLTDEDREIGFQKTRIPVLGYNLRTGEEQRFRSQTDAANELGLEQANVWKVLNGERTHTGGWSFEYLSKEESYG